MKESQRGGSVSARLLKTVLPTTAIIAATILSMASASAQSHTPPYKDLHDFGGTVKLANGTSGNDGTSAEDSLVVDPSGNKYFVCRNGGGNGAGALYEYTAGGAYIDLHDFGGGKVLGPGGTMDPDGGTANSCSLDKNGNLYGTTASGGLFGWGVLWEFTKTGAYKLLYEFGQRITATDGTQAPDGFGDCGAPVVDAKGDLFGVSPSGGSAGPGAGSDDEGYGMVWEIPAGGNLKDLHDFLLPITLTNGTTGTAAYPSGITCIDSLGDVYGVCQADHYNNPIGAIWEINTSGQFIDIHDFGGNALQTNGQMGPDGMSGNYIVCDANDNLFGTCYYGGAYGVNAGTVWRYSASGRYETLHNFGKYVVIPTSYDGAGPTTPLVFDSSGNIYGYISKYNGVDQAPSKFLWMLNSSYTEFDINDFGGTISSASGGQAPDGQNPAALAIDSNNTLFGLMSESGGANGHGFLYSFGTTPTLDEISVSVEYEYYYGSGGSVGLRISTPSASPITISLSSDNPNIPVSATTAGALPPTVVIEPGQTQVYVQFVPATTTTNQTATITASYNGVSVSGSTTLQAVSLYGFSVSSDGLGDPATGTIEINEPAPPGGLPVSVTSTNPNFVPPATVTIPAGQYSTQFTIAMNASTTSSETGTITATYGGVSMSQTLSVSQIALSSLSISPTEAQGSTVFNATVTLSGSAPTGGIQLTTSTNSPFVSPPPTVTVPSGSNKVTFPVNTSDVGANDTVLLRVTLNGRYLNEYFTLEKTVIPTLTNLTISPGEAAGGTTFNATATLSSAAPKGGTVIAIATNSQFDSPPATVTVPAGSTSVTFPVTTSVVSNNVTVLLKATLASTTKTVYFTLDKTVVVAPTLTNLTVSPSEGTGGDQFMATVTLSSAAPSGGTVVALATNSPFVSPPATITVPAGQTSFTFPVNTSAVSKSVTVLLKSTLGSTTKTFYFTLDP